MKLAPDLYNSWRYRNGPQFVWRDGKRMALWVAPNIGFYDLDLPLNPDRSVILRPAES